MNVSGPILPGGTLGVVGGGQLGRMFALDARRMGYKVVVLDPDPESPTGQVADDRVVAPYTDANAVRQLVKRCDVVTYEFENVNADAVAEAEGSGHVRPGSHVLRIAQHRLIEKGALTENGFPVPEYAGVDTMTDMVNAVERIGTPAVLKTATSGYDGKGQIVLRSAVDMREAHTELRRQSVALILESFVPFDLEISVIAARGPDGDVVCFPPSENQHVNGILDVSIVPARISDEVRDAAVKLASRIAEALDVVGLVAVEMFVTTAGELLVNEIAPRPHNSGHYTQDACATSQFEQLVRAICGLPLGSTELLSPVVMANLLGDTWAAAGGTPDWDAALGVHGAVLHLYGKAEARIDRKMAHINVTAPDVETALARALDARERAAGRG
ncbi:MAG: 5-(carboxyamino)imidazole ribonucleotide synthase [Dehalococcoidia bacterium]|nr:5-(carboxyamino)imidazole ribonucleotide synthase [Dehalococcoidia bacterium]MDP6272499.1 5-(carboxyamino)imidazole ribonucleotide synthase [Dehalococcoidia bacterium]MDP7161131.1 5-(carboxyamino)imidazole ribonucleotide synthase [Dehalococcoidia bacterium]MDP7213073.1 5-(carboxyamino)imidazole ribonucleotide synthase [Dehalococcoidia bacterium]MDP7515269.1 5-(carboxyamino)imidazole ribonucleotide synthase [Dehalococcoidia bacterium]